jgi:hypothetical protein
MSSSGEIEIGNIYKIAANEENDITPPDGRDSRSSETSKNEPSS